MKVAEDVALLLDVLERQDARREQHAEPQERHRRQVELQGPREAPERRP